MIYPWIWRHLPGNTWVRAVISLVAFLVVVLFLFTVVFPWAEGVLPFLDVTVSNSQGAAAP